MEKENNNHPTIIINNGKTKNLGKNYKKSYLSLIKLEKKKVKISKTQLKTLKTMKTMNLNIH